MGLKNDATCGVCFSTDSELFDGSRCYIHHIREGRHSHLICKYNMDSGDTNCKLTLQDKLAFIGRQNDIKILRILFVFKGTNSWHFRATFKVVNFL